MRKRVSSYYLQYNSISYNSNNFSCNFQLDFWPTKMRGLIFRKSSTTWINRSIQFITLKQSYTFECRCRSQKTVGINVEIFDIIDENATAIKFKIKVVCRECVSHLVGQEAEISDDEDFRKSLTILMHQWSLIRNPIKNQNWPIHNQLLPSISSTTAILFFK